MENSYLISYNYFEEQFVLPDFYVYQIGRIVCNENTVYPNHYHNNFYELTVVTKGEGTIYTNNSPVHVKAGDVYLSCLYDIHSVKSSKENPLQYDFCAFYPKNPLLEKDLLNLATLLHAEHSRLFHSNKISTLLPLAISEMPNIDKDYSLILLNSIFYQLAIYTLRILKKENIPDNNHINDKSILCYKLMDYINTNINEIRSLSDLSKVFHYSYNYLSTLFKDVTSIKLIDFYNMQRLSVAEKLIVKNELTLEEIAEKTNFSSAFALSKAFKKHYKLSPSQHRKQNNF